MGPRQALLEGLEETLESGLVKLELRKSNLVALHFYLRNEFKQTGVRPGYYGDGEDAILMERRIRKTYR